MNRWLKGLILVLALAALLLGGYVSYQLLAAEKAAVELPTEAVRRGNLAITISTNGNISYPLQAELAFPVAGTVAEVKVEEGQEVKAGELLLRLDHSSFTQAVLQAELGVKNAEIALKQAQEPYSAEDLLQAQLNLQNAQDSLTLAEHDLAQAPVSAESSLTAARQALKKSQESYQEIVRLYYGLSLSAGELLKPPASVLSGTPKAIPQDWLDLVNAVPNTKTALEEAQVEGANAVTNAKTALEQSRLRLTSAEKGAEISIASAQAVLREAEDSYRSLLLQLRLVAPGDLYGPPPELVEGFVPTSVAKAYQSMLLTRDKLEATRLAQEEAIVAARTSLDKAQQALEQAQTQAKQNNDKAKQSLEKAQAFLKALEASVDPKEVERLGMGGALAWKRITDAYQSLEETRQKLALTEIQATRSLSAAQGGVARARLSLALSQARLQELQKGADPDQVELKQRQLTLAQNSLQQALKDFNGIVLVAPFNGVVASVLAEVGSRANTGAVVAVLVDPSRTQVEATVDEIDVARVAVGLPAQISLEALPGISLLGRVKTISPIAQVQAGVVSYKVVLEVVQTGERQRRATPQPQGRAPSPPSGTFPRPRERAASPTPEATLPPGDRAPSLITEPTPPLLRAGMTALAEIVIERKTGVLLVPSRAVRSVGGKATIKVVGENGVVKDQEVTLGSSDGRNTEVAAGLQEGEKVVIPTTPTPTPRAPSPGFGGGFGGGGFLR